MEEHLSRVKVKKWTNIYMVREDEDKVKSVGITIEECGSGIMLYTGCVFVCWCVGVCESVLNALINTVDVTNLPSTDRMWIQSPGAITALPLHPCLCPSVFLGSLLFFSTEIDSLTADIKVRQTTGRETEICLVDATKHKKCLQYISVSCCFAALSTVMKTTHFIIFIKKKHRAPSE